MHADLGTRPGTALRSSRTTRSTTDAPSCHAFSDFALQAVCERDRDERARWLSPDATCEAARCVAAVCALPAWQVLFARGCCPVPNSTYKRTHRSSLLGAGGLRGPCCKGNMDSSAGASSVQLAQLGAGGWPSLRPLATRVPAFASSHPEIAELRGCNGTRHRRCACAPRRCERVPPPAGARAVPDKPSQASKWLRPATGGSRARRAAGEQATRALRSAASLPRLGVNREGASVPLLGACEAPGDPGASWQAAVLWHQGCCLAPKSQVRPGRRGVGRGV